MRLPIPESILARHRRETFRLPARRRVRTPEQAIAFVNERRFIFFWPIKGILFPSLWTAVAGDRPVASAHDDPGHVTWGWKDQLLDQRCWYYARILRGKATLISLEAAAYFYALSGNFGEPEQDYLDLYRQGLLSRPAVEIYEMILRTGPLDTVTLRRKLRMTGKASNSPFARGLIELQKDFRILPVGIARTGGWRYSFVYEAVHRHYSEILARAREISVQAARSFIAQTYFEAVGAASEDDFSRLIGWRRSDTRTTLARMTDAGQLVSGAKIKNKEREHFVLPELVRSGS